MKNVTMNPVENCVVNTLFETRCKVYLSTLHALPHLKQTVYFFLGQGDPYFMEKCDEMITPKAIDRYGQKESSAQTMLYRSMSNLRYTMMMELAI